MRPGAAAVLAARTFFLPYYSARMELEQQAQTIQYSSVRTDEPAAEFQATWSFAETLPYSPPGSLEFFLTERYCLYSVRNGDLFRARIHHDPWLLQDATVTECGSTMIESDPTLKDDPLLHYCEKISVDIWALEDVGE